MMTDLQRRVWNMRLSGMSSRAIATEVGRSPSTVEQCLSRAARNACEESQRRPVVVPTYEDADVSADQSWHIVLVIDRGVVLHTRQIS